MSYIGDKISALSKQLFPTGRAWKIPVGGDFEKLNNALNFTYERTYNDCVGILDSILPDNSNFTTDDATDWERRLGLLINTSATLADRMAAILRRLSEPGLNPAKQHYLRLQYQLQLANFNCYVYENRFPNYPSGYITETYAQFANISEWELADHQLGDEQLAYVASESVINHIDASLDNSFNIGSNLRSTFFIGGPTPGSFASVPLVRKEEFRHLILQLKPVQEIAYLLINYI